MKKLKSIAQWLGVMGNTCRNTIRRKLPKRNYMYDKILQALQD
jgi:hypothetical protein